MLSLTHLTLNTGHSDKFSATPAHLKAMRILAPLAAGETEQLPAPLADFHIKLTYDANLGAMWTLFRGEVPLTTCGLCWHANRAQEVWGHMERLYLKMADTPTGSRIGTALPDRPDPPWLATCILPSALIYRDALHWVADFNQCFAFTILQQEQQGN